MELRGHQAVLGEKAGHVRQKRRIGAAENTEQSGIHGKPLKQRDNGRTPRPLIENRAFKSLSVLEEAKNHTG
jgi:hypothetical protein